MILTLHIVAGLAAAISGWLLTRAAGLAYWRFDRWIALDVLLPSILFGVLLCASGRVIFAGVLTLAFGYGYAYAERAKRMTLREPIVFTDVFQAVDIFRNPQLAIPFQNLVQILFCIAVAISIFGVLFALESPLAIPRALFFLALMISLVMVCWLLAGPANSRLANSLRRAGLNGDPFVDTARFGTLGTLLGYGIVARAERAGRRVENAPPPTRSTAVAQRLHRGPVLLVQCESFFDARRLSPKVVPNLLPGFDATRQQSLQWGSLAVPCWGANTVRTEFAVLSGLPETAIGIDRFNPYYRFARKPVNSLAWRLRERGYRTICVHPFDRRFYGRNTVMPELGFDAFLGEEAFIGAPRINGFVCDAAIADVVETLVSEHHGGVFVFVITLENHGPWSTAALETSARLAPGLVLPLAESIAFERYLASLQNSDALLSTLANQKHDGRLIGFYGDHQPSLPITAQLGEDNTSDYLIYRADHAGGNQRHDIPAHALGAAMLAALDS